MAVNTFTTIKNFITDTLEDDGISDAADNWIALAEAKIYRWLRVSDMETAFSEAIASGVVNVPSDFKSWQSVWLDTNPIQELEERSPAWIRSRYSDRSAGSKPLYIGKSASTFIFGPYPDSNYTVAGVYYKSLTALSTSNETNILTTDYPDLLMYAALRHSAPYLGEDPRVTLWDGEYERLKNEIETEERNRRYGQRKAMAARVQ